MAAGTKVAIVSFSAATGKLQAVLTPATDPGHWYCGALWTDPGGRNLITQCGAAQSSVEGTRSTPIHLHQLIAASPVGFAGPFAW